jgi:MFS family permease
VHSYWLFLVYFVLLVGTGINGAIGLSGTATIAQWLKVRRSLAMGIYFTGSGGAGILLIPGMSLLIGQYGWRAGATGLGGLILVLTAVITPLMLHKPEQYGMLPDGGAAITTTSGSKGVFDFLKHLPLPRAKAALDQ